jgi:hypothetical protein
LALKAACGYGYAPATFTLNNTGVSAMTWSVSKAPASYRFAPANGVLAAGRTQTVTLSGGGAEKTSWTIQWQDAQGDTGSTSMSTTCTPPFFKLSVTPRTLPSANCNLVNPPSQTVTVTDIGNVPVNWQVSLIEQVTVLGAGTQPWASVDKVGGTLAPGDSEQVIITPNYSFGGSFFSGVCDSTYFGYGFRPYHANFTVIGHPGAGATVTYPIESEGS